MALWLDDCAYRRAGLRPSARWRIGIPAEHTRNYERRPVAPDCLAWHSNLALFRLEPNNGFLREAPHVAADRRFGGGCTDRSCLSPASPDVTQRGSADVGVNVPGATRGFELWRPD